MDGYVIELMHGAVTIAASVEVMEELVLQKRIVTIGRSWLE